MNCPRLLTFSVTSILFASPVVGCGSYDNSKPMGMGGQAPVAGQPGVAGSMAKAGAPSAGAPPAQAGSAPMAGASFGGAPNGGTGGGSGGTSGGGQPSAGGAGSCMNVTPCGGDVVGMWTVKSSCLNVVGKIDVSGFGLGCTEASIRSASLQVTGSFVAMADGTFTDNTRTTGEQVIDIPEACLNVSGTVTECDRLGSALESIGLKTATCVDGANSDGCVCTATIDQKGGMAWVSFEAAEMGNYTAMNNVLKTSYNADTEYDYCVAESTMTVSVKTPSRIGPTIGTVVLQK